MPTRRSSTRRRQRSARRARRWREQAIHLALAAIFGVVAEANRYFAGQEPWALKKTDPARMETVLLDDGRNRAARRDPVPALHSGLGGKAARPAGGAGRTGAAFAHVGDADALVAGTPLPAPQAVFPRYVERRSGERLRKRLPRCRSSADRWRRVRQTVHEIAGATYVLDGCSFELPPSADDVKRNIRRGNYAGGGAPARSSKWLDDERPSSSSAARSASSAASSARGCGADTSHVIVEANSALVAFCRATLRQQGRRCSRHR